MAKDITGQKHDQIIDMLGDLVEVFGKRFDKIEHEMATKGDIAAVHEQVNVIERQLRETRTEIRLGDLEEKVFGAARR
jgi:predicted phage tail protein